MRTGRPTTSLTLPTTRHERRQRSSRRVGSCSVHHHNNPKSVINTGNAINASIGFSTDGTTTDLLHDRVNPVQEKKCPGFWSDR